MFLAKPFWTAHIQHYCTTKGHKMLSVRLTIDVVSNFYPDALIYLTVTMFKRTNTGSWLRKAWALDRLLSYSWLMCSDLTLEL